MKFGCYRIQVKGYALFIPALFMAILTYYIVDSWKIILTDSMLTIRWVALLMALSLVFIIKKEVVIQKTDDNLPQKKESFLPDKESYVKFLGFALLSFLYIAAFVYGGFILSTLLFPVVAMMFLGVRDVKTLVLVPALSTMSIYVIFKMVLSVPLPTGLLGV